MAPGIRLFRSIRFSSKAAAVTASFMVPLLLMAFSFWNVSVQGVDAARMERTGVAYVKTLLPLLDATQNRRRAATAGAPDLPEAQIGRAHV